MTTSTQIDALMGTPGYGAMGNADPSLFPNNGANATDNSYYTPPDPTASNSGLGSLLGGLLGAGTAALSPSTGATYTNQSQTQIPDYLAPYVGNMLSSAQQLAGTQYQPYTGQQVADLNGTQQQAFQNIGNMANNPTNATMTQGSGIVGQAANQLMNNAGSQWNNQTAQQYMNPYTQQATNVALQQNQDLFNQEQPAIGASAAQSGAYGGDRQAVVQAQALKNFNQQQNNIEATGLNNAYNTGMQAYATDKGLSNTAAGTAGQTGNTLAGIGQQQYANQLAGNQNLLNIGNQQQAQTQTQDTTGYNNYLTQLQYPYQQLSFMSQMMNGLPASQTSTAYTTPTTPQAAQIANGAVAGANAGSNSAVGSALGGIANGISTIGNTLTGSNGILSFLGG